MSNFLQTEGKCCEGSNERFLRCLNFLGLLGPIEKDESENLLFLFVSLNGRRRDFRNLNLEYGKVVSESSSL